MSWPWETRTSTCRNFATISSGLYRFLAIAVLLDVETYLKSDHFVGGWISEGTRNTGVRALRQAAEHSVNARDHSVLPQTVDLVRILWSREDASGHRRPTKYRDAQCDYGARGAGQARRERFNHHRRHSGRVCISTKRRHRAVRRDYQSGRHRTPVIRGRSP